jgi:hypothetical protein
MSPSDGINFNSIEANVATIENRVAKLNAIKLKEDRDLVKPVAVALETLAEGLHGSANMILTTTDAFIEELRKLKEVATSKCQTPVV